MSTPLEAFKKRKRSPKIYGLYTFGHPGRPIAPSGSSWGNIRVFLRQCSEPEGYNVDGMPVWRTLVVHENRGFLVPLYTIEESVTPFCDHCRWTECRYSDSATGTSSISSAIQPLEPFPSLRRFSGPRTDRFMLDFCSWHFKSPISSFLFYLVEFQE